MRGLLSVIFLAASTGAFFSTVYWLVQSYLQSIGIPEKFFGLIYALPFVSSAGGAFVSGKIRFSERNNYLQIVGLGAAGAFIPVFLYFFRNTFGIAFILLNQFLIGFSYPVIFSVIRKKIGEDSFRATALSAESFLQRLLLTTMIFFVSTVISEKGVYLSLIVADFALIVVFGVSFAAYCYVSSKNRQIGSF